MFASNTSQVSSDAVYVEDVFSTYLYAGTGSSFSINNGIDLSTKGGMVWMKGRDLSTQNAFYDTARGATNMLRSPNVAAQVTGFSGVSAFNSNGFTVGTDGYNNSGYNFVSWTFRKQPKFFDVVTFTTDASGNATVSHSLGATPGCILIKKTSGSQDWKVYHRGLVVPTGRYLELNTTGASVDPSQTWITVSSTQVSFPGDRLDSSSTFVAYLFAHNAGGFGASGNDNVISCGSYTGTAAAGNFVNLGYEPQWIMVKNASSGSTDWSIFDTMRGIVTSSLDAQLAAQSIAEENGIWGGLNWLDVNATGFTPDPLGAGYGNMNVSGSTYIYIAIRRGPMKTPTSGTSVFQTSAWTGNATSGTRLITGFGYPTDLAIFSDRQNIGGYQTVTYDRLRNTNSTGGLYLITSSTAAEGTNLNSTSYVSAFQQNNGFLLGDVTFNYSGRTYVGWQFGRAPGFMDVVCYTGNDVQGRAIEHNLQAIPELIICKQRNAAANWYVWATSLGATEYLRLQLSAAKTTDASVFGSAPNSTTTFPTGGTSGGALNALSQTYVAYLFATCPGVSKVGSYTGNGSSQTINCGFTGGARFVLIKRTDALGGWCVFDTARGIVSGNDPLLALNSTSAEYTTYDIIDPDNTGFIVNQEGGFNLNANGGTYIYLAIA